MCGNLQEKKKVHTLISLLKIFFFMGKSKHEK